MCFSAAASFASAALLVPVGITTLWKSWQDGRSTQAPLALMPLGFGLQQSLEGLMWLRLVDQGPLETVPRLVALAYLFFALAFWPIWIPFVAICLSRAGGAGGRVGPRRRRLLMALQGLGLLLGLGLWLTLLLQPARIHPSIVKGSIDYGLSLLLSGGAADATHAVYAAVISVPLLLFPSARLRCFGITLLMSGLVAEWFYHHAFASVWCYFSALLSLQVVGLVWSEPSDSRRPSS